MGNRTSKMNQMKNKKPENYIPQTGIEEFTKKEDVCVVGLSCKRVYCDFKSNGCTCKCHFTNEVKRK